MSTQNDAAMRSNEERAVNPDDPLRSPTFVALRNSPRAVAVRLQNAFRGRCEAMRSDLDDERKMIEACLRRGDPLDTTRMSADLAALVAEASTMLAAMLAGEPS